MAEEEKKEYKWTVLSRRTVTTYPRIGETVETVITTYVGEGLPPLPISIPKAEWSREREDQLIAKDIHERLKWKPEVRRAPIPE